MTVTVIIVVFSRCLFSNLVVNEIQYMSVELEM
jgi:hypothetical protein